MSTRARWQTCNTVLPVVRNGIISPTNDGLTGATQFRFTGSALIQQYPATYIWRALYRQQTGYHTNFFRDHDGAANYTADQGYFGCHPYPLAGYKAGNASAGTTHNFEISCDGRDYCGTVEAGGGTGDDTDDNGNVTSVVKNQWYIHAMTISAVSSVPTVKFYWDLGTSTNRVITHTWVNGSVTMPADTGSPYMVWLSSGWTGTQVTETQGGTLRGIQLYTSVLSLANMVSEANNDTVNGAVTSAGQSSLWYINQNPTPSDISDKSGNGHHPAWLGPDHGTLYTA